MIRYARGFLSGDYGLMAESAPQAMTDLRQRGEHYVADCFEVAALAVTLLMTGRLEEHDALVTGLVERHRAHGPPTLVQWALTLLGSSASVQGRVHEAWNLYEEAGRVDVPHGTYTMKNPLEARAAMRRDDRAQAFRILRSYIGELLDLDNMYGAKLACIEFIAMMVRVDRLPDAARILGFLESSGALDAPALRTLVSSDAERIATDPTPVTHDERTRGRDLDERRALGFIRDVLGSAWSPDWLDDQPIR